MKQSMQARSNEVEFTNTARNAIAGAFRNFVQFWESVGRAKAAQRLYNMGYHEQAKNLILGVDKN